MARRSKTHMPVACPHGHSIDDRSDGADSLGGVHQRNDAAVVARSRTPKRDCDSSGAWRGATTIASHVSHGRSAYCHGRWNRQLLSCPPASGSAREFSGPRERLPGPCAELESIRVFSRRNTRCWFDRRACSSAQIREGGLTQEFEGPARNRNALAEARRANHRADSDELCPSCGGGDVPANPALHYGGRPRVRNAERVYSAAQRTIPEYTPESAAVFYRTARERV